MTDNEAINELKGFGCNYVTFCADLKHLEKTLDNLRTKYMTDLETHCLSADFSGEFKGRLNYVLGVVIPYYLLFPPKGIQ